MRANAGKYTETAGPCVSLAREARRRGIAGWDAVPHLSDALPDGKPQEDGFRQAPQASGHVFTQWKAGEKWLETMPIP